MRTKTEPREPEFMEGSDSALFLFQSNPQHKPFSLTGKKAFYLGSEDFIPDGSHEYKGGIKNGLYHPPYRLIDSIYVEEDGEIAFSNAMRVSANSRLFFFNGFSIEMSFNSDSSLCILVKKKTEDQLSLKIHIGCDVVTMPPLSHSPTWRLVVEEGLPVLKVNSGEMSIAFESSNRNVVVTAGREVVFSVEEQESIVIRRIRSDLSESLGPPPQLDHEEFENYTLLSYNGTTLKNTFAWAKVNLWWLYSDYGKGLMGLTAGLLDHPWFESIDTFVALEGLLASGFFSIARNSLETLFLQANKNGGIMPAGVLPTGEVINGENMAVNGYMPTALKRYYNWTGDQTLIREFFDTAARGFDKLVLNELKALESGNRGVGSQQIDIETICCFIKGGQDLIRINRIIHGGLSTGMRQRITGEMEHWSKFLLKEMWMDEHQAFATRYIDGVPVMDNNWTTILPFAQKIADRWHYERFIRGGHFSEVMTDDGLRMYSDGIVTPVTTGLMVKSALNYSDVDLAWDLFKMNAKTFGKYSTACFPEKSNDPRGSFIQAASAGVIVENIVGGFMGVYPINGRFNATPMMPKALKYSNLSLRNLRVGGSMYNISTKADSYLSNGYSVQKIE